MKIGFLFAGQGAQYVGMGKDFYEEFQEAREVYDQAHIDFDVKEMCFQGPVEKLNETSYSQPCILTTSLAIAKVIESKGIQPSFVAGLSLGEYSALTYAGAFQVQDAVKIVRTRGQIMSQALPEGTTKMAAILAMDAKKIEEVIAHIENVEIANYNCPGQIVITGTNQAVDQASDALKEAGAKRIIPLNVSGAFHSPLLEQASQQLNDELQKYNISKPHIPVVYNVSGKEEDQQLIDILTKQIKSSVYFYQSIQYMIEQGVDTFIEIGPGHALSSFVKKTDKTVQVYSVDRVSDLNKLLGALNYE